MAELPATDRLVSTRNALHRVAEHVLAAARKTAVREISLEQGPGGFRTPPLPGGAVIAVEGTDIFVKDEAGVRRAPLTTVRAAAELVGIEPGFPWTKHPPATPLEPDVPLEIDPAAARVLADWFALGQVALTRLVAETAFADASEPQIYPEHFDLAVTADQVNYGFSPGDEAIPLPYAYVGPHAGPLASDDFWNAAFGAYRTIRDIRTSGEALEFLIEGRELLGTDR